MNSRTPWSKWRYRELEVLVPFLFIHLTAFWNLLLLTLSLLATWPVLCIIARYVYRWTHVQLFLHFVASDSFSTQILWGKDVLLFGRNLRLTSPLLVSFRILLYKNDECDVYTSKTCLKLNKIKNVILFRFFDGQAQKRLFCLPFLIWKPSYTTGFLLLPRFQNTLKFPKYITGKNSIDE